MWVILACNARIDGSMQMRISRGSCYPRSMRGALALLGIVLAGCGGVTRTVALKDSNAYANREPVVSMEGYELEWSDGGKLAPVARDGLCLVDAGEGEIRVGERDVPLRVLDGKRGAPCEQKPIRKPVSVSVRDDTLTIVGRDGAVQVPTRAVFGVRVYGARDDGEKVAEPTGLRASAEKTKPRSLPLVVAGSILMTGGFAGGVAIMAASALNPPENDAGAGPTVGWVVLSFAAGLGGGIPMIALGARRVPADEARAAAAVSLGVGPGGATASVPF